MQAPVKLLGGNIFANKNKMAATGGLFFPIHRPQTYHVRTVLFNMDECEVIERFRLSSARINWLVEKFHGELQRYFAKLSAFRGDAGKHLQN